MTKNKDKIIFDLVTVEQLAEVTGTSERNILESYVKPKCKRDKSKMLKALAIGTYMLDNYVDLPCEIKIAVDYMKYDYKGRCK